MTIPTTDEILGTLRQVIAGNQEFTTWTVSTPHIVALVKRYVEAEREECAKVCDELGEHWGDYKDTALLNGDVALSNAASGEPRAAARLATAIRARGEPTLRGEA